jgi:ABC-2 type transport system ATP-binding protein
MNPLVIENLSKRFGEQWAVRDLNLELTPGEIFVLLGPNGAGKTTTLKLIAGLLVPSSGSVSINGIDIRKDALGAKQSIGFVPDEPFIYPKLTGREFINLVASIYGVEKRTYHERINELRARLEIGEWIDQPAETYSHGMKQKIIMCQLLLHDPLLIMVDEPLVGLDPKISITIRRIFQDLKNRNRTLLVSTHTLSFARDIASRIGIINHGTLKFTGTFDELSRISGSDNIEDIYLTLSG